jgi:hypothetical protein
MFRPVSPSSAGATRSRWRCPGTINHDPSLVDNNGEFGAQRWHWHGGCISMLGRSSPQSLSMAVHTMLAARPSSALWLSSSTARSLTEKQDTINPTQQSVWQYLTLATLRCLALYRCPARLRTQRPPRPTRLPRTESITMHESGMDTNQSRAASLSPCVGYDFSVLVRVRPNSPVALCVPSAWPNPAPSQFVERRSPGLAVRQSETRQQPALCTGGSAKPELLSAAAEGISK